MSLNLHFTPKEEQFTESAAEYALIWKEDAEKIQQALANRGLEIPSAKIEVIVFDGVSNSGQKGQPMHLRYSYPTAIKKGTLIHELGHRLLMPIHRSQNEYDPHQVLNLVLYDIWNDLYGKEFADLNVKEESKRTGIYDYKYTWQWALKMTKEERSEIVKRLLTNAKKYWEERQ